MTTNTQAPESHSVEVKLTFPDGLIRQPVLAQVIRQFDVMPSILHADVSDDAGHLVCEFEGAEDDVKNALGWLTANGVAVDIEG